MGCLGIIGNPRMGKEIIDLLKMLGGVEVSSINGTNDDCYYFIGTDNNIYCSTLYYEDFRSKCVIYHFSEFKKKYPFVVGDMVSVRDYESECKIYDMRWNGYEVVYKVTGLAGEELTVEDILTEKKLKQAKDISKDDYGNLSMKLTTNMAWDLYNFINLYKSGKFGLISLQDAIDKYFEKYVKSINNFLIEKDSGRK